MSHVLVTPRSITKAGGHCSLERLVDAGLEVRFSAPGRLPTDEELPGLLEGCFGYLAGVEPITDELLSSAKNLRVISRNGTGIDNIDLAAAKRHGIAVCRALGANAQGVAELALSLLFALARNIPFHDSTMKTGKWDRKRGIEVQARRLGVVGCGAIGKRLATMALGVGMNVVAYDLYPDETFAPSEAFSYAPLDEVLSTSDFVSLHCPPPADNTALLDAKNIAKLRDGALVINTARSALVDERAMLDALEQGKIAGMATDVYDKEPPENNALLSHPNVIATPHIGGFTANSVDRAMDVAVDNILQYVEGLK